jgi:Family of unknown function (DUF6622)
MRPLAQIISTTPPWVWVLLAFLLFLGVRALWPATAPVWRVAILPTVFFTWGLISLVTQNGLSVQRTVPWALALLCGTFIGMLVAGRQPIRTDKTRHLIQTAGGPLTLVLILLIFSVKYVFGFLHATQPGSFADARFWLTELAVSGVLTGMFIGRFAGLWQKYRAAPHENLAA